VATVRLLATVALMTALTAALAGVADAKRAATPGEVLGMLRAIQLSDPDQPLGCIPLAAAVSSVDARYGVVRTIHLSRSCGDGQYLLVEQGTRWRIKTEASEWHCNAAPKGVVKDLFGACLP